MHYALRNDPGSSAKSLNLRGACDDITVCKPLHAGAQDVLNMRARPAPSESGVYTPVVAKHSKHFLLEASLAIGVDRMQRNFGPLKQQVKEWRALHSSTAAASLVIYQRRSSKIHSVRLSRGQTSKNPVL